VDKLEQSLYSVIRMFSLSYFIISDKSSILSLSPLSSSPPAYFISSYKEILFSTSPLLPLPA